MAGEWVESLPLLMLPPLCTLWGKEAVLGEAQEGEQGHRTPTPLYHLLQGQTNTHTLYIRYIFLEV
jgi:hypothetical protein